MALAIATNNAALQAAASASSVNRDMETSMARLSTGRRIDAARDDAAGVAIASRLATEIRGTDQAIRNALDGQALIDSAEGGHKEIENILQRMREVSVQAANDTNNADDRSNLQAEMNALTTEIDRIASVTTWAGQKMMDSKGSSFSFQVGTATGDKNQISANLNAMSASALSLSNIGISEFTGTSSLSTNPILFLEDSISSPRNIEAIGDGKFVAVSSTSSGSTIFKMFDQNGVDMTGPISLPQNFEKVAVGSTWIGFHDGSNIIKYSKTGLNLGPVSSLPADLAQDVKAYTNTYDVNGEYGDFDTSVETDVSTYSLSSGNSSNFTITNKSNGISHTYTTGFGGMSSDIAVAFPTNDSGVIFGAFDETQRAIKLRVFGSDGSPLTDIRSIPMKNESVAMQIFSISQLENGHFAVFTENGIDGDNRDIISGHLFSADLISELGTWTLDPDPKSENLFPKIEAISNSKLAVMWKHSSNSMVQIINVVPSAGQMIQNLDAALLKVNTQRSNLGAISNRLSHTVNNLTNISANLSSAKGVIEDADFAHETSNLAKNQILQQASTAMLAQANASKQSVLTLLQG